VTAWQLPERTTTPSRLLDASHSELIAAENSQRSCRREAADLSNEQIESMSDDELFELIRASEHPWDDGEMERHLIYADRSTLLRLTYLVRNCCRNAECAAHDQARMDELDGPLNRRDAGTLFGNPR